MVRKRKPLNSVDGNRVLTDAAAAAARGKSLRRPTTDSIMDHQDDDAYDFLSTSSSFSSSRPLKRAKRNGTSTSSAAVHHQHHNASAKYAGNNGVFTTDKTPRISNLSAAEQKARVAAWVLPPRTPKPSHLTTMVVMSATTNTNTNTNARTNHRPELHPLPQRRHPKPHPQPSLPQQRAERARERPSPATSRISASHRVPPAPPAPPPLALALSSKGPRLASNATHAAPRSAQNSLRDDALDEPQPQQSKLNSQPSLMQSIANANHDNNNNNDENDDMDLDSDNESLGVTSPNSISGGGVTATALVHENSTAITTAAPGLIPITDATKDKEWVLKAPSSANREAAVRTEILRPVPRHNKLIPNANDYQATDAAAAVVVHDAKQRVVNPVYPAKKPRWLHQSTTPDKQPVSSAGANDGASAAAATTVPCAQSLTTKTPCSNASSPVQKSPLLLEALEIARQRQSANKEEVHSPSIMHLNQAPPATDTKQVRLVAPKSAVQKRIEKLLRTPATTHSPSMLENLGDPSSQLARPLSRNVMEKYRRSSADNEKVVQAMMQSGTTRTKFVRTPDSPTRETLALIGTTVKLQLCDSLDGSVLTMEDLQHKIRPKVRAKVLEREQQTARPEVHLDDANPITEETIQVQPPELPIDEEEELAVETPEAESLHSNSHRDISPELETRTEVESLHSNSRRDCSPELETTTTQVERLHSKSLQHCSPELWTVEAAGHTNHAPIFELRGGVLYRHPPMPPGWSLGVSKSKNKPYYHHPDFGTSFFCPVTLPSANESLVAATRVTQPGEQSVGTFSIGRVEMGSSPATDIFETPATSSSRGDSHGTTPALQSGSTTTAFYTPDTIGVSARTLFAIPSGSETPGTDADNALGSTGESVLGTQASPRGVNAFSSSGPDSQMSPTTEFQETVVEGGKHARRQDERESLATDEDSASRSNTTSPGESAVPSKVLTPEPLSEALAMVEIEETVARVKHARYQEGVVLATNSLQGTMKEQHKKVRVIRDDSSTEPSTGKHERNFVNEVECNNLWAEKRLGVGFSSKPNSEMPKSSTEPLADFDHEPEDMPKSSTEPPADFDHEPEDELIGLVVRTPVETGVESVGSPFPDNDNDSLVSVDNTERPPFQSGNKSSPTFNVSVNNEGRLCPSTEDLSPMAGQNVHSGVGNESPQFLTDDWPSPTPGKSDRSGGGDESPPLPIDDRPSPTSGKSGISAGDESPPFPTDDGRSPTSGKSGISAVDESPPFPTDHGPSSDEIQYASANNLTPHLDAQVRKPSSNFSPVFSRVDSFDRVSELGDEAVSHQSRMNRRKDLANLSRVISYAKPLEDEVSALNNDGMSYVDTGDYSYASRSLQSKDSQGTSLVSRMSHRVRYPPMPLCILQNLESLPFAKKQPKRKKNNKKKKSKKKSMPPRDVLDSLGSFS